MQRQGITVVDEEEDDGALNMQPQRIREWPSFTHFFCIGSCRKDQYSSRCVLTGDAGEHHHSSMSMDVDSDERAGVGDEDLMDVGEGSGARSVRAAAPTDQMSDNEEDEDDEFEKMKKLKNVSPLFLSANIVLTSVLTMCLTSPVFASERGGQILSLLFI